MDADLRFQAASHYANLLWTSRREPSLALVVLMKFSVPATATTNLRRIPLKENT